MPKKHKAPWGFNGYGAWNRRHAARSLLRLPVPPGEFRHPDFAAAFAKADRDAAKQRVSPAPAETVPTVAAPGGAASKKSMAEARAGLLVPGGASSVPGGRSSIFAVLRLLSTSVSPRRASTRDASSDL